ncbi:unnamed protein product [Lampetra fluviatilis]
MSDALRRDETTRAFARSPAMPLRNRRLSLRHLASPRGGGVGVMDAWRHVAALRGTLHPGHPRQALDSCQ